ncbi:thermonuclease family protein [Microbacterium sp. BK668]|uniref:thermonuclease family protein n=1 Tax=Microbacterium sp. BK668 TaxID=2512118 RepID=UPI001414EBAE|nr:thermonuclease family protein [Microbacterium sp. BK668]
MRALRIAVVVVVTSFLVACSPGSADRDSTPTPTAESSVTFLSVLDGDTIETSAGTVRLIGIDAPERGECGFAESSALISSMLNEGDSLTLELPEGQNDTDQHGRMLRYVGAPQSTDLALPLLTSGLAVARYDSTDGYPAHPREPEYHGAQVATLAPDGTVMTTACKAAADAAEQARIAAEQQAAQPPVAPPAADEWWKQYTSCTKLKDNPNGHPTGPFSRDIPAEAPIYDWFANGTGNNGDGEGDGLACE